MSLNVTKPGNVPDGAVPIRVSGECGHEWIARTTKAAAIQRGVGEPGRSRIRLYCPECFKETGEKGRYVDVTAVQTKRKCRCGTVLNSYNPSDTCGPCQHDALMRASVKTITTEDRILGYLLRGDRSAEWLASVLRLGLVPTRKLIADLIDRGLVDFGDGVRMAGGTWRTTYKLVVDLEAAE